MKAKALAKMYILILSLGTILSLYIPKNEVTANEMIVIPNEAIRLRILANSDSEKDQEVKRKVRDVVNEEITKWVSELTSVEEARALIESRLPEIQALAEQVLEEQKVNQEVRTDFGRVEFPTKLYGEFLYPAGEYEAILITLGEGKGANWWCVLFPPLCFLDFSNSVAVSEGIDEAEDQSEDKKDEKEADKKREEDPQPEGKIEKDKANEEELVQSETEKEANSEEVEENGENTEKNDPLYVEEEEESVKVKFFILELFEKIFG